MIWKNRSWLRLIARHLRSRNAGGVPVEHGLVPETYFLEKLAQEGRRALRSNKPLVLMIVDAENVGEPGGPGPELAEALGEQLNACVRESDICGLLRKDVLIGVILTEVEAAKIGSAQLVVAKKTRERLAALLSLEQANRIAISFRIFAASDGARLVDLTSAPELIAAGVPPKG